MADLLRPNSITEPTERKKQAGATCPRRPPPEKGSDPFSVFSPQIDGGAGGRQETGSDPFSVSFSVWLRALIVR